MTVLQHREREPAANIAGQRRRIEVAFVDRRLHDRAASEDVVQETFVGFLNSLPNFDETRELQTYLFTIASHKVTDHLRRSGRHPLHAASEGAGDVLQNQYDHHPAASSLARESATSLKTPSS